MAKRRRAIDEAKNYREKVISSYENLGDPWSLPGMSRHPNRRVVYLQMLPKEKWRGLFNKVGAFIDGRQRTMFGLDDGILELATGEKLVAAEAAKFASHVKDASRDFSAELDHDVQLLIEFAITSGRLAGWFDDGGEVFVCTDGRRLTQRAFKSRQMDRND